MSRFAPQFICFVLLLAGPATSIVFGQSSTLMIRTMDDYKNPIPAVDLVLEMWSDDVFPESKSIHSEIKKTNERGIAWFYQLRPGVYTIRASRSGFEGIESERFIVEQRSVVFGRISLIPFLTGVDDTVGRRISFQVRKFPAVNYKKIKPRNFSPTATISEIMESLPGVLTDPETGIPRFPSQRTTDVSLFIDGIPVQDPVDQRPAFFPPSIFIEDVVPVRAGQDVDQQAAAGGAIHLRTRHASGRQFAGMFGVSDIVANASFIRENSAGRMFDYWDSDIRKPSATPDLTDRRCSLLLDGRAGGADLAGAIDWRESNRGYTSDIVNAGSLDELNAWGKIALQREGNLNLLLGYQKSKHSIRNQWRLREYPPLDYQHENLFAGLQYRRSILSTYWIAATASALYLASDAFNEPGSDTSGYPYNLGEWFTENSRSACRLNIKAGNTTRYHDIEAGLGVSRLAIDVQEGFRERTDPSQESQIIYQWDADIKDIELSMWGHDRWFLSENLEIGFAIRWDRFNYLDQIDYLSPRLYIDWAWGKNRLTAGVERVVQSPGIGFISDQVRFPVESDELSPVTEPQLGFRWYSGYHRDIGSAYSININGFYTLLSKMIYALPLATEPGIELLYPATGEAGKMMGAYVVASWVQQDGAAGVTFGYGACRSRVAWGEDTILTHIRPYPEQPWSRMYYSADPGEPSPMDNEFTHALRLTGRTRIPVLEVLLAADYRVTTGRPYTKLSEDTDPSKSIVNMDINSNHGDFVQRLDLDLYRDFDLADVIRIQCRLSVRNILNTYQFPTIDPFSGEAIVDPYRLDQNQPRTLTAGLFLYF